MKKYFALAAGTMLVAGTALAQSPMSSTLNGRGMLVQPNATFGAGLPGSGPLTTNNDDTCDISTAPAATLLLPYFEVDFTAPITEAVTTAFTITNVSQAPQIAHITLWTDWSFPVLDFNIFLTGYDVQGINLQDIIRTGIIAPNNPGGGSGTINTGVNPSPRGPRSLLGTTGNVNFSAGAAAACAPNNQPLPGQIPTNLLADIQRGLTGRNYGLVGQVGSVRSHAVGYVTIDVANTCSQTLPTNPNYYSNEILYDNVLIGDYLRINPTSTTGNYAGGNPMVHIRAIPEGGPAGFPAGGASINLPYTFYDRYTPSTSPGSDKLDRRQPLPGLFAARFIESTGGQSFGTRLAIWREGITGGPATEQGLVSPNSSIAVTEFVRFDERENPTVRGFAVPISPAPPTEGLPETSARPTTDTVFPPRFSSTTDVGGWMYLNLNNGGAPGLYSPAGRTTSQNWVTVQMTAEGRFGVDFDAAWLGNGCSPNPGVTSTGTTGIVIGPSANVTP